MILQTTAVPFSSLHRGGGESYPWRLAAAVSKLESTVICFSKGEEDINDSTVKFEDIPARFLSVPPFVTLHNPIPKIGGLLKMKEILSMGDVDIVHVHNLRTFSTASWLILSKLVKDRGKLRVLLTDHLARVVPFPSYLVKFVDYYVPVSKYSSNSLQRIRRLPELILPPIIPENYFSESKLPKDVDLIYFGRIVPWKRPDLFLALISELKKNRVKNVRAILAGFIADTGYLQTLQNTIHKLGIESNVTLATNPSDKDVQKMFARSKLLVQLSWYKDEFGRRYDTPELSPIVVPEAAASGLPVVVSNIPMFKEIVKDKVTGIIVDPTNLFALADKTYELLIDDGKLRSLGENARRMAKENNSPQSVSRKYMQFISDIRNGVV